MQSVPEQIEHYRSGLEKAERDENRLLHCLRRLDKLPITVLQLRDSTVGHTVNSVRSSRFAKVAEGAQQLVRKWKLMVAAVELTSSSSDSAVKSHTTNNNDLTPPKMPQPAPRSLDNSTSTKVHHPSSSSSSSASKPSASTSASSRHHSSGSSKSASKEKSSSHSHSSSSSSRATQPPAASGSSSSSSKSSRPTNSLSSTPSNASSPHKKNGVSKRKSTAATDPSNGSPHKSRKLSASEATGPAAVEEIDSSMGTSFADALGMMAPPKKRSSGGSGSGSATKSKSKKSASAAKPPGSSSASTSSSSASASTSKHRTKSSTSGAKSASVFASPASTSASATASYSPAASTSKLGAPVYRPQHAPSRLEDEYPPQLLALATKLAPLDRTIVAGLQDQFVPMEEQRAAGGSSAAAAAAAMSAEELDTMMGSSMASRSGRTKVFSGRRANAVSSVTSLMSLCHRVLQRNINALYGTGGVPYDVLKPTLMTATPEILLNLEYYNAYLVAETDPLWELHCGRKFRGHKPHEMESWRELFLRLTNERESRLSRLTQNIKQTQMVAVPVKQTKITFVDSAVKPPRDVRKKQERFGTERQLVCTPAARVESLSSSTSNVARPGDVRLRVAASMRDNAQVAARPKTTKAPLMAKTLQTMKSMFRR